MNQDARDQFSLGQWVARTKNISFIYGDFADASGLSTAIGL